MLEGLTPPVKLLPCAVRTLLEGLDQDDVKILNTALADHDAWPNKTLSRALAERGVKIGDGAIRKHRARECSCR